VNDMTDLATDISAPLSTTLDLDPGAGPSGAGAPRTLQTEPKEPSLRDTIEQVVKEDTAKVEEKPKEKVEAEPKPEKPRDPTGKFAANEKPAETEAKGKEGEDSAQVAKEPEAGTGQDKTAQDRPSEGKRYPEPPARFQPDSKEQWRNVPRSVQRDVEVMTREHDTYRQSHERYEPVRQYDEIARQNGRTLQDSLAKVVEIEDALAKNPIAGLDRVLQEVGPRKPNGQPYSLFEVAQHIVSQGPQAYQQMSSQAQQEMSQTRVQQLEQENAQLKQAQQGQALASQIIAPFAQTHPRYFELEDDIALFLQSGRIDPSLSPAEKLAAAYDMAERLNPPSHVSAVTDPDPDPESRAVTNLSGTKSIKSAPGAVSEELEPDSGGSIRDILESEAKRMARRS